MIANFPLTWPRGWNRSFDKKSSKFGQVTIYAESVSIERQLKLMHATEVVISSNMRYRQDGLPYAQQGYIEDNGVAVYFTLNGEDQCIPCDKWNSIGDNLRAINRTVEALRGIERWGAKEMVNAAFRGFKALPASIITESPHRDWWVVLGVDQRSNVLEVKQAYRELMKIHHPDAGGNGIEFEQIQRAYEEWKAI